MHYYKFNVEKYKSHTEHLDNLEDLAYRRMLDYCYMHESPLPKDIKQISKLIRMREECERITDVLQEFFVEKDDGWYNVKVNAEILEYRTRSEKAKASAKARWDKKSLKNNVLGNDAKAMRTHSEGNAKYKKEEEIENINNIPYQQIVDNYNEFFSEPTGCSKVERLNQKRKTLMKKAWKYSTGHTGDDSRKNTDNVDYWKRYFEYCSGVEFFKPNPEKKGDHSSWSANFDFLLREDTYTKVIEGDYQ